MDLNKKELSHEVLIETLRAFAPTLSPEGVCNGVTSMWMQAVLTNAEQEINFYKRLDAISLYFSDPKNNPKKLKREVDELFDLRWLYREFNFAGIKEWNAEEITKIEIRAFSESAAIQQDISDLAIDLSYQTDKTILYPLTASVMLERGHDVRLMSDLNQNKLLEQGKMYVEKIGEQLKYILLDAQGEVIEDFIPVFVEHLTSAVLEDLKPYILDEAIKRGHILKIKSANVGVLALNPEELSKYFDDIKIILENNDKSNLLVKNGFLLNSNDHAIGVYLDKPSGKWHFFDINQLSGKERYFFSVDSEQLALLVFNSYTDQNFENTFFYVKYLSNSYDAALVDQLKNVSNKLVLDSADRVHPISGYTTLHLAATCGDVFTLDILLSGEELPNINALTEDNNSPLILAALNGHLTTILVLLKNDPKPDLNLVNKNGWTALMAAAENGSIEIVAALLSANPKPKLNIETIDGYTALMLAYMNRHEEICNMLHAAINAETPDLDSECEVDSDLDNTDNNHGCSDTEESEFEQRGLSDERVMQNVGENIEEDSDNEPINIMDVPHTDSTPLYSDEESEEVIVSLSKGMRPSIISWRSNAINNNVFESDKPAKRFKC